MQITLQQVRPVFLEPEKIARSQVWGQQLALQSGSPVQIIAPSGSGKTSLIHFLYGLRRDYEGSLLYDGQPIGALDAHGLSVWRQKHVSIVFQDLRLFTEQLVFDNINIKRMLSPYHNEEKVTVMAERLGIAGKLQKKAHTCSYGEQQRIAIIRSLMQPFDFLLLDEPFSHLDEVNRHKAMELMLEEADSRKASIILADLKRLDYFPARQIINL